LGLNKETKSQFQVKRASKRKQFPGHIHPWAMGDEAPLFRYAPLSGPRDIRILVLEPAQNDTEPIHLSFIEISLPNHEEFALRVSYEAVSYTWGAPHRTQPVYCEGQKILVTPNCEQVLVHLRRQHTSRRLWVDAVCINQQCMAEKNTQVPLMGKIYQYATCSILWLGRETNAEISGILHRAATYGGAYNRLRSVKNSIKRALAMNCPPEYNKIWQAEFLREYLRMPT
jgi:hypothetical protein